MLQIDGAKDIVAEFTSLSKSFSMPGWRMGFAVGNQKLIAALTRIKSYLDYGAFTPIQVAAAAALDSPDEIGQEIRKIYKARRDVLVDTFSRAGWDVPPPPATMFAWSRIPAPFAHMKSLEFSTLLLQEAEIAVSPGIGFGEYGDDYVRIALVENEQRIRQAGRNLKRFFDKYNDLKVAQ
jgi:alanine-synthesizing transaminase